MNVLFFIQIILESLPISSSGHLILVSKLNQFVLNEQLAPLSFLEELLAHIPALLMIGMFSWKYALSWFRTHSYKRIVHDSTVIALATGITACGILFFHIIAAFISFRMPLWYGFVITALILFHLKSALLYSGVRQFLTYKDGLWLGLAQIMALTPGVSRFAVVLSAALFLGFEYRYAFMIYCALQAFVCFGGAALAILGLLIKQQSIASLFSLSDISFIIMCFVISSVLFFGVIQQYLKNKLWSLGFYMCFAACLAFFLEHTKGEYIVYYLGRYIV